MGEQNEVTDSVIANVDKYDILNAPNRDMGEEKFKIELEKLLNRDDIDFKPLNRKVFECRQGDTVLPFIIKCPSLGNGGTAEDNLADSKKYIELLGKEFVEEMSPVTITNPKSVTTIKEMLTGGMDAFFLSEDVIQTIKDSPTIDVFVQNRRDVQNGVCVWDYVVQNYETMNPEMRIKLTTLLERVRDASNQGYVIDLPEFPKTSTPITGNARNWDGLMVDGKGPTIIDSSSLIKFEPGEQIQPKLNALGSQIALDLLNKRTTTPEEAYATMKQESAKLEV